MYLADNGAQYKCIRAPKYVSCPTNDKVQLYDHRKHQSNMYNKPVGVVEKIQAWNEVCNCQHRIINNNSNNDCRYCQITIYKNFQI